MARHLNCPWRIFHEKCSRRGETRQAMWTSATKKGKGDDAQSKANRFHRAAGSQRDQKKTTTKERAANLGQVARSTPATDLPQRPGSMRSQCQDLNKPIADCPEIVCLLGTLQITH
jgi:hypothetical protein